MGGALVCTATDLFTYALKKSPWGLRDHLLPIDSRPMGRRDLAERHEAFFFDLYASGFTSDIPLYLDLAAKYPGPVLEVGCSAGRVTERLARAGHEVVALEPWRPSLALARQRCRTYPDRVRLQDHDLRRLPLPERFNVVFVTLYHYNYLIDLEEERLFLRHARQSMRDPGIIVLDCFCPLSIVAPDQVGCWRVIERTYRGHHLEVRDRREMLNPLLELRTQVFRLDGGPEQERVTYRRYVAPPQAAELLTEAGFENVRWIQDYDLSTARTVEPETRPTGPFRILGEL
jgi:SAM-dependent methyltransferase